MWSQTPQHIDLFDKPTEDKNERFFLRSDSNILKDNLDMNY